MSQPSIDDLIAKYMELRDKKTEIELTAKGKMQELSHKMAMIEAFLLEQMQKQGTTSVKTAHGTAYQLEKDYANVSDFEAFLDFVRDKDAWDLLEKRVSKMAVKSRMSEGEPPPPGVTYGSRIEIAIRKPKE